jgi:hypothetical protein
LTKGLVLGTILAFILAACGGDDPTAAPAAPAAPAATATSAPPTATLAPGETPQPTATNVPAPVFDAAAYFEGKTIKLVANSNPGGGTDAQGRVMAAFISKWIPGNPRVVFSNSPNKPQEYLFAATRAPKDGTYVSWNSTPQLDFGFIEDMEFIKRSTFQFIGATIDATRAWMTYDPVGNLGPSGADNCIWDYAGQATTGGGSHGEFLIADEISDIADGDPTVLASMFASEALNIPFRYIPIDTVDTNAVMTMWLRGDMNTTIRASLWYRFPLEQPDWIPSGLLRAMAGMGPGELGASGGYTTPCDKVTNHLDADDAATFDALMNPTNYMSKALWLPPGTPDEVADALSAAFEQAFAEDVELVQKYSSIAGEVPLFTDRESGTEQTLANENLFQSGKVVLESEKERLLQKYFPQYLGS